MPVGCAIRESATIPNLLLTLDWLGTHMNNRTKIKVSVPEKPINVTIANVISWYEESECCIFNNHAERIPVTSIDDTDIVQSIIDSHYC